jgi:hypothetical protein
MCVAVVVLLVQNSKLFGPCLAVVQIYIPVIGEEHARVRSRAVQQRREYVVGLTDSALRALIVAVV